MERPFLVPAGFLALWRAWKTTGTMNVFDLEAERGCICTVGVWFPPPAGRVQFQWSGLAQCRGFWVAWRNVSTAL